MNIPEDLKMILLYYLTSFKRAPDSEKEMSEIIEIIELFLQDEPNKKLLSEVIPNLETLSKSNKPCNLAAIWFLGFCYFEGLIVKQDTKLAVEFFAQAADKNFAPAQFYLGKCYRNDILETNKDGEKGNTLLLKAAAQHDALALYFLHVEHRYAWNGREKNMKKAIEFLELSAKLNYTRAREKLGLYYEDAQNKKPDFMKAFEMYELNAKQGISLSESFAVDIALKYVKGNRIAKDSKKGLELLERLSNQGSILAKTEMATLYEEGKFIERDFRKSFENYQKAAKYQNYLSLLKLGKYYFEGLGVKQDIVKSIKFYKQAEAQNGNPSDRTVTLELAKIYESPGQCQNLHLALEHYKIYFFGELKTLRFYFNIENETKEENTRCLDKAKDEYEKTEILLRIYKKYSEFFIRGDQYIKSIIVNLDHIVEKIKYLMPLLKQSKINQFFEGYDLTGGYLPLGNQLASLFAEYELQKPDESDKTEHKRDTSKP